MSDHGERTEQPTPRRVLKAREEGDFPVSRELTGALQFFGFVALLSYGGQQWFADSREWMAGGLQQAFRPNLSVSSVMATGLYLAQHALLPLVWAGLGLLTASLLAHLVFTGMGVSFKKFSSGLSNFKPMAKLKEVRSQALQSALQAAIFMVGSGFALYGLAVLHGEELFALPLMSLYAGLQVALRSLDNLLWKAALVFGIFGAWDMFRQRRRFWQRLKMTKQQVKQELKESEGSPEVKSRIRRIQRGMLRHRMMSQVPQATAVIVNPTHFAVAIRYDHETMPCPVVVAKGKNYLALRIKECAIKHGVAIVENPPLAQALYKSVQVGQEVPPTLYRAIAEVLAFIYRVARMNPRVA
ncbi:MAG: EscU/YscU/HrcU family type III secretion system export apparatus switch protein [Bryobacterales bacterium]|nr:EscU/YscU/HrcU family type III secretion system export apparatus switch protein [Bryobacterales bacterium]